MNIWKQDGNGRRVKIGDTVKVIGIPDLSEMAKECRKESEPVFRHLVGKTKRIRNFNELGMAELNFRMKRGRKLEMHSVWIETCFLRLGQE